MTGLDDLTLLKKAEEVADAKWKLVQTWKAFDRDTLGKQLVRVMDSVGANVAEAFGRFHYGESCITPEAASSRASAGLIGPRKENSSQMKRIKDTLQSSPILPFDSIISFAASKINAPPNRRAIR